MQNIIWSQLTDTQARACLKRPAGAQAGDIEARTRAIVEEVRTGGDAAVLSYTQQLDNVVLDRLHLDPAHLEGAAYEISAEARQAIKTAHTNIMAFHRDQGYHAYNRETAEGVTCSRVVRPIEAAGLYIPGGTAPLISTTLMLGVPAHLAGCERIVLCTPCDDQGQVDPHIGYAAHLCGIETVFRIGGAQAIAAMGYGTESVPACDKLFGPGNAYVAAAKAMLAGVPGGPAMDLPAGPSEVCVIADSTTDSGYAAADLVSQAEHDILSQVVLITTNSAKSREIREALETRLADLPRRAIASQAIANSLNIIADDMAQALEIANMYAPEHLILCFEGADDWLGSVRHAGSVFLGPYSPEAAGDYCSGTNHALPTYGSARSWSGLGVEAFQTTITVQSITREGLEQLGPTIETLAELEGLDAHAQAVRARSKT
jgi:histidinol dehydrogenase